MNRFDNLNKSELLREVKRYYYLYNNAVAQVALVRNMQLRLKHIRNQINFILEHPYSNQIYKYGNKLSRGSKFGMKDKIDEVRGNEIK